MKVYILLETENTEEAHTKILAAFKDQDIAIEAQNLLEKADPMGLAWYSIQEEELIE